MTDTHFPDRHVVVVGAGITGLSAAHELLSHPHAPRVTVLEADTRVGGKIRTTPFAGLPAVDEGADAYLTRVPWATRLARQIGLDHRLTSPAETRAAIWHGRLHPMPEGLVLGMPSGIGGLVRSGLLSTRGVVRAGLEPLKRQTPTTGDSLGAYVRARFGKQVHERLVDPLVGSIYAADTDRFSLAAVPQIADLAAANRSIVLGGRKAMRARRAQPAVPAFEGPIGGMGELITALTDAVLAVGGTLRIGDPARSIEPAGHGWLVNGEAADAVILATNARDAASLVGRTAPAAIAPLTAVEYANVALVTLALPGSAWPVRLADCSGYLVPKDVQGRVTAVSFGSSKWAHWRPPDGSVLVRVSLGRDGAPVDDLDDAALVATAAAEMSRHLRCDLQPTAMRVSRWSSAFPQYRPHHFERVDALERTLASDAPGVVLAGASYRGIGIPACIQQGLAAAGTVAEHLRSLL